MPIAQLQEAVRELDKTLELAPKDDVAKKVRDVFAGKGAPPALEKPAPSA